MDSYLECLRKYAVFSGRSGRQEYWMFVLVNVLVVFVLGFLDVGLGLVDRASGYGILSSLYGLAVLLPGVAASARRLHDTGHSGWWLLIGFVPVLGVVVLLYFMVRAGDPGKNDYGPNANLVRPGNDVFSALYLDESDETEGPDAKG